jgi:hypothetical protein
MELGAAHGLGWRRRIVYSEGGGDFKLLRGRNFGIVFVHVDWGRHVTWRLSTRRLYDFTTSAHKQVGTLWMGTVTIPKPEGFQGFLT